MKISELQKRAMEIRNKYSELNAKDGHNKWQGKDFMMGFVGDVGDLNKLVMAKENMRAIDDMDKKLEHELGDCLWSLLVLAENYDVDLEKAFLNTMNELDQRIAEAKV
jgi:NTP pyrophosphatase (non-canonical NTP hydrolase)